MRRGPPAPRLHLIGPRERFPEVSPGRMRGLGGCSLAARVDPVFPGLFFAWGRPRRTTRAEVTAITDKRVRVNEQIRISPIRLIDDEGNQVGIVSLEDARERAAAKGLDMVEVAPEARPPVVKLMAFGQFKYEAR